MKTSYFIILSHKYDLVSR